MSESRRLGRSLYMNHEPPSIERRRHTRVNACGAVVLRSGGREISGRSVVVSETMLEVSCPLGFELLSMAGASVEIEMRLDDAAGWFIVHGQVARMRASTRSLIFRIAALPAPLASYIAARTEQARSPVEVMVVDHDLSRRTQVAEAFRAEGCHVVEASTPLEAIDMLGRASVGPAVIAVADTTPDGTGVDLRNYLDTACIDALVVGVGHPEWIPTHARLDPSDAEGHLRAGVKSVLLLLRRRPEPAGTEL